MNFVDILLIIPLIYAAWIGFRKGFIIEIFTLLALLVGIYAGIHFSDWTSQLLLQNIEIDGRYLPVIAFTLTFLGVGAMVYFLGKVIEKMLKVVQLGLLNRLLGLLFSVVKMVYILSILLTLIETYDQRGNFIPKDVKSESVLYKPIELVASTTIPAVEKSTIWLQNNLQDTFMGEDINRKDVERIQHTADSLGVTIQKLLQIKKKADSLGISVEDWKKKEGHG